MTADDATAIPLHARINGARAWKPAKDRTADAILTGTVVAVIPRTSEYGTYPVVVMDTGAETFEAFHAFHTVAMDQLKKVRPTSGEALTIVAHPRTKTNKRVDSNSEPVTYTPYTIFNPDVTQEVDEYDWDAAGADATPGF